MFATSRSISLDEFAWKLCHRPQYTPSASLGMLTQSHERDMIMPFLVTPQDTVRYLCSRVSRQ